MGDIVELSQKKEQKYREHMIKEMEKAYEQTEPTIDVFYKVTWKSYDDSGDGIVSTIENMGKGYKETTDSGTESVFIVGGEGKIVTGAYVDRFAEESENMFICTFKKPITNEYFEALEKGRLRIGWC